MKKPAHTGAPSHRFSLMADRYRKFQAGDKLQEYDVKRDAFNLLAPHEQYHFFTQLPDDKRADLWQNKLSPEQRIGFALHDYHLVPDLAANEQDQWAATAMQRLYRGNATRRQLAAQKRAPYADEQTFYWANRSPELIHLRSDDPVQFSQMFSAYASTAPLTYFGHPMLFHSMRRPDELDEVARRFGMRDVEWMRYMPSSFGGHTWEKNLVWMQGGMHRDLPVVLSVPLDDETIVRGSLLRSADTSLHSTEAGLAAYPREILAMRPHYRVVNRQDGLQALVPQGTGRRVTLEELREVPATMPKEELRQTLGDFGLDVSGISHPGAPPVPLREGVPMMTPAQARARYFHEIRNVGTLQRDVENLDSMVVEHLGSDSESGEGSEAVPHAVRAQLIGEFRQLLMRLNSALSNIDCSLKLPLFNATDQEHEALHEKAIQKFQGMADRLEWIRQKIFTDDATAAQRSWTKEFLDAKLDLALALEGRLLARLAGESPPSSIEVSSDEQH